MNKNYVKDDETSYETYDYDTKELIANSNNTKNSNKKSNRSNKKDRISKILKNSDRKKPSEDAYSKFDQKNHNNDNLVKKIRNTCEESLTKIQNNGIQEDSNNYKISVKTVNCLSKDNNQTPNNHDNKHGSHNNKSARSVNNMKP